ncbi:uncharacterized protein EMH_0016660 [Eimeria mitis]|uniref:Uncharacterized protein n=1 Tax=Eimeria mitis TaxID=44415 RepID=U6KDL7_9EIME|nr:uncharacterized protein EMH_0016660 [Eimeria mitis]CDJ33578.1 hypothetical protein, conserved [Eimeria mitis]
MGKYALLFPRLVNNAQLRITQTAKVCPRQLLDAALLAPPLPSLAASGSSPLPGTQEAPPPSMKADSCLSAAAQWRPIFPQTFPPNAHLHEGAAKESRVSEHQHAKAERTWEILEMHAVAALPSLSPAGILQFLFLALRANFHPKHFLAEYLALCLCCCETQLRRFALDGEPAAPPVDTFWLLWTANDLALFCKLHHVDDADLVAKLLSRVATSLSYFSPEDVALILGAAAGESSSSLRAALLQQQEQQPVAAGKAAQPGNGPEPLHFPPAAVTARAPSAEGNGDGSRSCKAGLPLFLLLLQRLASQLQEADVNDCVRAFFAASGIYAELAKDAVSLSPPGSSGAAAPQHSAVSAALEPFRLLTEHLRCKVAVASASAKLRVVTGSVRLLQSLRKGPGGVSLQEAVAAAVDAAAATEFTTAASSVPLPNCSAANDTRPMTDKPFSPLVYPQQAIKVAVLKSPLFAVRSRRGKGSQTLNCDQKPAGSCSASAADTLEEALKETLLAFISSLCSVPGDLKAAEGMIFLGLLWQLCIHYGFSVPFSCVEGLYFHLLANFHQLSAREVVALTASFELCHSDDDDENCSYGGQLTGDTPRYLGELVKTQHT